MPLVQVQCAAISSLSSAIRFPYSNLIYPPPFSINKHYKLDIIRLIFAANLGKPVQYRGRILSRFSPGPSLGAVIRLSQNLAIPDGFTTTAPSNASVLAYTINSRWSPVQLYLQPYINGTVHSDNTYAEDTTPLTQIQIDPSRPNP